MLTTTLISILTLPLFSEALPTKSPKKPHGDSDVTGRGQFQLFAHNVPNALSLPLKVSGDMIYIGENPNPGLPYTDLSVHPSSTSPFTLSQANSNPPKNLYFDPLTSHTPQLGLSHANLIPTNAVQNEFKFDKDVLLAFNSTKKEVQGDWWALPVRPKQEKEKRGEEEMNQEQAKKKENKVKTWAVTWNSQGWEKENGFALTVKGGKGLKSGATIHA